MSGLSKTGFDRHAFYQEVYDIVQNIPAGRVTTYGLIARLAGKPSYSRLVGKALAEVPATLSLPCHRVVNSQGYTAPHWTEQQSLLESEGIRFTTKGKVTLKKYLWSVTSEIYRVPKSRR